MAGSHQGRVQPQRSFSVHGLRACFKIRGGPVFGEKPGWRGATRCFRTGTLNPRHGSVTEEQRKPDGLLPENPPGGGSFARGRRWLAPYSPLRGCSELAALATAKIPRRRPSANFKTGSK